MEEEESKEAEAAGDQKPGSKRQMGKPVANIKLRIVALFPISGPN